MVNNLEAIRGDTMVVTARADIVEVKEDIMEDITVALAKEDMARVVAVLVPGDRVAMGGAQGVGAPHGAPPWAAARHFVAVLLGPAGENRGHHPTASRAAPQSSKCLHRGTREAY